MTQLGEAKTEFLPAGAEVDLTNCDREPIHLIEHVQPWGALFAFDPVSDRIVRASKNIAALLGEAPDTEWVGAQLDQRMPTHIAAVLRSALASRRQELEANPQLLYAGSLRQGVSVDVIAHVRGGLLIVEFEPAKVEATHRHDHFDRVRDFARRTTSAEIDVVCQHLAVHVKAITGYDRVMVYRFAADEHGWVSAEEKEPHLEPFLGLHYPASDIPKQARLLFLLNRVRMIVDRGYAPAPLNPGPPLDLSHSVLRGVSTMHLEYLANMGVTGTMSVALSVEDRLWGLIACHHYAGPKHTSHSERAECEIVAQLAANRVAERLAAEEREAMEHDAERHSRIVQVMAATEAPQSAVLQCSAELSRHFRAHGFVAWFGAAIVREGETPDPTQLAMLVRGLDQSRPGVVFCTEMVPRVLPECAGSLTEYPGLLAVPFLHAPGSWLLWFRKEQLREIQWAGDPNKAYDVGPHGLRLTPRASFEEFTQTIEGRAESWTPLEERRANRLRIALSDVVYRERAKILTLNDELRSRREELESFSTMASHDLREPLRGISNYARFLREDVGESLDEESRSHLAQIDRLVQRMYGLLEGLLFFSRMGRIDMPRTRVDYDKVVQEILDDMRSSIVASGAEVRVVSELPVTTTWEVGIRTVLSNLLSNANKYADHAPRIEVGACRASELADAPPNVPRDAQVVYVRDYGIGFDPTHSNSVFRIFHRLHADGKYGGGSGTGLPIVRKVVERLGGNVWARSAVGQGATFFFYTPSAEDA